MTPLHLNLDCTTEEEVSADTKSESNSEHPSSHHYLGNQTKNITTTGPTTVLVNSIPSSSTPVLEHTTPNDLAPTPAFPPVQPTNIKYPSTVISGKSGSFNPK